MSNAMPFCPLLTKTEPSRLVPGEFSIQGIPCLGQKCMWFAPITDPAGNQTGGHCAPVLLLGVVNSHAGAIRAALATNATPAHPNSAPPASA